MTICKKNNLIDVSNSSCISRILRSHDSACNRINGQHTTTIEEISQGILLLNAFNGTICVNDNPHNLQGTFIINYNNTKITVEDQVFTSNVASSIHALPAILQPTPREKQFKEILSLEMMKELHLNNTDQIKLLTDENTIQNWTSYGFYMLITIIILTIAVSKIRGKGKAEIIIKPQTSEKTLPPPPPMEHLNIEETKTTEVIAEPSIFKSHPHPEISRQKFYDF